MDSQLRSRIMWLLGLVAFYKLGTHIPTPGVNGDTLSYVFNQSSQGTLFGLLNLFSGGALSQFSLFALGIAPYISASIIFELAKFMFPPIERLQKEGEHGRRQVTQYTRYLTIAIAIVQSIVITSQFSNVPIAEGLAPIFPDKSFGAMSLMVMCLVTGAMFTMWIGEQITERGIGNGSSIIIFVGIASSLVSGANSLKVSYQNEQIQLGGIVVLGVLMIAAIAFIVLMEQAQRRIPIQYTRRMVGKNIYGGQESHLPLKINSAGVIPPIFASTMLVFPATIASFVDRFLGTLFSQTMQTYLNPSTSPYLYNVLFIAAIIFFCFFYTAVQQNPNELADNLRKSGAYVPGIRPGKATADFLDTMITRLTFMGALYLSLICILPSIIIAYFKVSFYFGGTTLLILVGVALDTMSQLQAHLMSSNYDVSLKAAKMRGRGA